MFEEGVKRTARRRERCQGPSVGRQRPAREAPRLRGAAPARPCAPNRPDELRAPPSAAQVRARGPLGSPPARPARPPPPGPTPGPFPSQFGNRAPRDKEGGRAGGSGRPLVRRPSGIGGKSRQQRPPLAALFPGPLSPAFPPRPCPILPRSSPAPPGPAPCPLLSQPCGRPSPGGVFPRSHLLRRALARPAGRRLMCPASPSPSPPPAPLLQLSPPSPPSPQSPAEAEAAPAAASRSRRRDPRGGACALRAAVGAGASRRGLGAGGARHVALGWEGAPRSERAAARASQLSTVRPSRALGRSRGRRACRYPPRGVWTWVGADLAHGTIHSSSLALGTAVPRGPRLTLGGVLTAP